jgi:hypothetical protein
MFSSVRGFLAPGRASREASSGSLSSTSVSRGERRVHVVTQILEQKQTKETKREIEGKPLGPALVAFGSVLA